MEALVLETLNFSHVHGGDEIRSLFRSRRRSRPHGDVGMRISLINYPSASMKGPRQDGMGSPTVYNPAPWKKRERMGSPSVLKSVRLEGTKGDGEDGIPHWLQSRPSRWGIKRGLIFHRFSIQSKWKQGERMGFPSFSNLVLMNGFSSHSSLFYVFLLWASILSHAVGWIVVR